MFQFKLTVQRYYRQYCYRQASALQTARQIKLDVNSIRFDLLNRFESISQL